jgi:pimeloyl-ACP methyl ester carboxylesterase
VLKPTNTNYYLILSVFTLIFLFIIAFSPRDFAYSNQVKIGKNMIHYIDSGKTDAYPLLMIHGLGENLLTWQKILNRLPQENYRFLLVDLPGHGQSTAERMGKYSHRHLAQQLIEFLDTLSIKKVIIIGHSLGGNLALRMALLHPERVQALFLISPAVFSVHGVPLSSLIFANPLLRTGIISIANKTLRSEIKLTKTLQDAVFDKNIIDQNLIERIVKPILRNPKSGLALYYYLRDSSRNHVFPDLKSLTLPIFIMSGREDSWVKISEIRRLNASLNNVTFLEIYQCGHMPQEEKPDKVVKQLIKFTDLHSQ